jgi:hypothetical protein
MEHTAGNGVTGNYFRILRIDGICDTGEPVPRYEIWVGFFVNQKKRAEHTDAIVNYRINVPFKDLKADPRTGEVPSLYSIIKNYPPFAGNAVIDIVDDTDNLTLDAAKAFKNAEINSARLAANLSAFAYAGKYIACDALSRSDIDATNGYVALMGTFPPEWVGKWKAQDNSYVSIESIDDWKSFYAAMVAQGQANFRQAQGLKQLLAGVTSIDQLQAIQWGANLATFVLPPAQGESNA